MNFFMKKFNLKMDYKYSLKETNSNLESFEKINVDAIPLCNDCLFEIKDGNFICQNCKINLCDVHQKIHINKNNTHIILELIKN